MRKQWPTGITIAFGILCCLGTASITNQWTHRAVDKYYARDWQPTKDCQTLLLGEMHRPFVVHCNGDCRVNEDGTVTAVSMPGTPCKLPGQVPTGILPSGGFMKCETPAPPWTDDLENTQSKVHP